MSKTEGLKSSGFDFYIFDYIQAINLFFNIEKQSNTGNAFRL